nr:hypothetical protein [Tanacetum cinerariifolium]
MSQRNSKDDESDDVTNDDDDVDSDADGDNEAKEYEELYKDVNARLRDVEHSKEGKEDAEKTDADSPSPADTKINSMMNIDFRHEEPKLSQLKQVDYFAQLLENIKSQIPAMLDAKLSTRLEDSIKKAFRSYTTEFKTKAQDERKRYIYLVENYAKDIIKDEFKSQLPQILPKEAASSLTEFELKKILLDKMQKSKFYQATQEHSDLNDALVKSYKLDKDLFEERPSQVELKYHFKECYKAIIDRLNCNNPEGQEYPFDLRKPLLLIKDRVHQVVPVNYFINNVLVYLKGGSSSKKYMTSTTKTKASKYDDIQGIEDMVSSLWRLQRRRVVILKQVEDLQLRVKSYQNKLNITKSATFRTDISKRTPYIAYNNPQGIIYVDKFKRNRLIRLDELYKFSDGTLTSV